MSKWSLAEYESYLGRGDTPVSILFFSSTIVVVINVVVCEEQYVFMTYCSCYEMLQNTFSSIQQYNELHGEEILAFFLTDASFVIDDVVVFSYCSLLQRMAEKTLASWTIVSTCVILCELNIFQLFSDFRGGS